MRALVKTEPGPGLELCDVPLPEVGPDEVRVRIRRTAICGTDVHIERWDAWAARTIRTPMIIGHEFVGDIESAGSLVRGLAVGDRVSGEGHIVCGICRNCRAGKRHLCRDTLGVGVNRQGAFADYLVLPATNVVRLPPDLPLEIGSILDPLGNALHTALKFDLTAEDVLITGAGPIGIMAAAIATHVGAKHVVITDFNPYRLELAHRVAGAETMDATHETLSGTMRRLGMREGFDVGLEMSGSGRALNDMIDHMVSGGRIALLGIQGGQTQISWDKVVFNGLTITGIYGREMFETWYKMLSMLQTGLDVSGVITHRFTVDDFAEGFAVMRGGQSGKVILDWDEAASQSIAGSADSRRQAEQDASLEDAAASRIAPEEKTA